MRRPKGHPFPVPGIYTNFLNVPDHLAHSFEKKQHSEPGGSDPPEGERGVCECEGVSQAAPVRRQVWEMLPGPPWGPQRRVHEAVSQEQLRGVGAAVLWLSLV